ncbi:hypothetical protein HDU91_001293, partial [Kappamyces sp. JEL0680]
MGLASSKPSTFTLRRDDSLNIPISFDPKLIERLAGEIPKEAAPSPVVRQEPTERESQGKRAIWEARSVAQTNLELDELSKRMP